MSDTWAAFNPQPAPEDPWASFNPEAAAKPMPENGVIDIYRASPFVSSESEAAYSASLPEAFLDRLRRGQALGRILNEALKGMQEGFGDEPVVGSDAHLDHLLSKLSIDREDSKASPLAIDMVAAGVASMKSPALAPVRALAGIVDATMRGINSGLHAGAGGIGQIISELGGDGAGARKEIINFGNFAMIEGGMGRFSRPTVGRIGPGDQPIGGLPKAADFTTSAELLAGAPAETIVGAAIVADGRVFIGPNHVMAIDQARKAGADYMHVFEGMEGREPDGGFFTSKGRYVSREEAAKISGAEVPEGIGVLAEGILPNKTRAVDRQFVDDWQGQLLAPRDQAGQAGGAGGVAATERNLRDLWEERGIHPAEVVHDAQSDAFLRRDITRPSFEAYHGSPHDFGAFSLEKIGAGEGVQSYGHGLYFAEHPEVAREYQVRLSGDKELLREKNSLALQLAKTDAGHPDAIAFQLRIDELTQEQQVTRGVFYRVRILADREHFLDWDKPISEQPPKVKEALERIIERNDPAWSPSWDLSLQLERKRAFDAKRGLSQGLTAGELFGMIEDAYKKEKASALLREAGIPGIKYLDQGSRGAGEFRVREADGKFYVESNGLKDAAGQKFDSREQARAWADAKEREGETSNFVLFDDKLVEITHKNGIALRDLSLEDAIDASQGGGLISRARELGVKTMVAADKVGLTDVPAYEAAKLIALGADVTGEVMPTLAQQPAARPGRLVAAVTATSDKLFDIGRDIQMKVAPMATGTRDTMAMAKDFANTLRRNSWEWARIDDDVAGRFTAEQRKRMWDAADEESVARQLGESREHQGLVTLTAVERAAVEDLQSRAQVAWLKAVDLGMVEGEGLPAYTPRFVLNVGNPHAGNGPIPLNGMGTNLRVRTPQMRRRKHMTAEETEAAAKRLVGDRAARELKSLDEINAEMADVQIARDIRALPLATAKLEDAIAGRTLINNIKEHGRRTGDDTVTEGARPGEGWFTIDHPAFRTWKPKFEEVDGAIRAAKDADGNTIFEQVPIYVRGDFEGPLRAVLTQPSGATYQMFMELKGKTMSMIMNSPMIHNAVEWGRALPAMPGKVVTFRVYFEGNRAKKDVAVMHEAIDGGLVPIGKRFFNQDITSIMEAPDLTPGRSWTAKVLAAVPGLFDEAAGTAVKTFIDKAGDFWHNTLLWDRVGDLQMGLYTNLRDDMLAKGIDRQTAVRAAAHWANRYAGALPQEAMSDAARKVSNVLMFSRSFTLGNLGAMKDMLTGLPKDVLAQIERDAGFRAGSIEAGELAGKQAVSYAKGMARRKAMAIVGLDIALMYVGNSLLQSALNVMVTDRTLGEELHGYAQRFVEKMQSIREHPLELLQPFGFFQSLSATAENEPGRENRIHVGETKDGTAIYARNPAGKIGEEFEGYLTGPLDMIRRKLGTIARPAWQIMSNDAGFGRKIVDPTADTPAKYLKNIGAVVGHLVKSQFPEGQFDAFSDLVKGEGDAKLNALQAFGPLTGVTFSKGAPGGPAVGELYHAREMHNFQINAALPDIRKQFQRGDIAEARQRMNELGIPPGLQRFYEDTSINPTTARMRGRTLQDFYRYATPEQRERLDRARIR